MYFFPFVDSVNLDLVYIKVGRTSTMNRRIATYLLTCPPKLPTRLGYDCPWPNGATKAELPLARVNPGSKVPLARMPEDLVHLEHRR